MSKFAVRCFVGVMALIGLGLLLVVSECFAAVDDGTVKSLQGVWSGVRFSSGKGEDPAKGVKLELTVKGNQIVGKRLPKGALGEGTFKIAADGRTIDALGTSGGFDGKNYPGIMKIEGDTWYWCTGTRKTRPKGFVADPTEGSYLLILKRQKS